MPQDFTQAFDIEAKLYTSRGKCMSQCMKIYRSQTTLPLYITEIILHGTWFYIFFIMEMQEHTPDDWEISRWMSWTRLSGIGIVRIEHLLLGDVTVICVFWEVDSGICNLCIVLCT